MSRINLKIPFDDQIILQTACYKKHLADGDDSILTAYLDLNKIDFAMDVANGVTAARHHVIMNELMAKSEIATSKRNKGFAPLWKTTRQWAQDLKALFPENEMALTDWGISIGANGKIKYPSLFTKKVGISQKIIARHNGYKAGTSPLQAFITANGNDLTLLSGKATDALAYDIARKELKALAVKQTQDRNKAWAIPFVNLKGIGHYISSLFPENQRALLLWGFDQVDEKAPVKVRKVTLRPLEEKCITGIVSGSLLTNIGTVDLIVRKGKKGLGKATVVKPGDTLEMTKGYSAIVASNTASIGHAIFTVPIN